jgi:hypothetical protein
MTELYAAKLNGVEIAVKTNTAGVDGLDGYVDQKIAEAAGNGSEGAVQSVNGKTGAVILNAADVKALPDSTTIPTIPGVATASVNGLMAASDKVKLDALPVITFEKVGAV